MGRRTRPDRPGGWYHVMNRGVDRGDVYFADVDRVEFGRLLGVVHERYGVEVHAYCLMPNHFHLVMHCPHGALSSAMHDLATIYTRHTNDRIGRDGPLFRGRFHSIDIATDDQLLWTVRYVHRNPLELGVEAVESYRWSSHRTYLGARRRPPWIRTERVLGCFGGEPEAFHRFVTGGVAPGPIDVHAARLRTAVDLVAEEFAAVVGRSRQGLTRQLSLLVLDRLVEPIRGEFASMFDFPSKRHEYQAIWRARRRQGADRAIIRAADRVVELAVPVASCA